MHYKLNYTNKLATSIAKLPLRCLCRRFVLDQTSRNLVEWNSFQDKFGSSSLDWNDSPLLLFVTANNQSGTGTIDMGPG